jgi:hypothetical protein
MALGDKLSSLVKKFAGPDAPPSPWHPVGQPYPLLMSFEPAPLAGKQGIVAIWHLGVRPQWLKVASVRDVAAAITYAKTVPEIVSYRPNGEVYVAWTLTAPTGAVQHLIATLAPILKVNLAGEVDAKGDAVSFPFPPGTG